MIYPQSLVHNERMLAIFKYKTTNILNTDLGKTRLPGEQDKQVMMMKLKIKQRKWIKGRHGVI